MGTKEAQRNKNNHCKTYCQLVKIFKEGRIDIAIGTEISMDAAIEETIKDNSNVKNCYQKLTVRQRFITQTTRTWVLFIA